MNVRRAGSSTHGDLLLEPLLVENFKSAQVIHEYTLGS